jgi:hypothetical protein
MQEVDGHLYYLLDPLEEPGRTSEKKSPSPDAPPLPNHRPPSLSPVHRSSLSNTSSPQHSLPLMRPKAHTFSTSASDHR